VAEYTITFACSARRELEALDARLIQRIVAAIEALAKEPRPRGFRKLRGENHLWKIRIGE
jgi:mRNA interferase RelE/StbE